MGKAARRKMLNELRQSKDEISFSRRDVENLLNHHLLEFLVISFVIDLIKKQVVTPEQWRSFVSEKLQETFPTKEIKTELLLPALDNAIKILENVLNIALLIKEKK